MLLIISDHSMGDNLISVNAGYRLHGDNHLSHSFVWYGDKVFLWPGTNTRAIRPGWHINPLIEMTDRGDLLIDGITDQSSLVYTPGDWSRMDKRIVIELRLPGRSTVTRVVAHLQAGDLYHTESAEISVPTDDLAWQQIASVASISRDQKQVTFELDAIETQTIKLMLSSGAARIGITEIEVFGAGPTESPARGLIRSGPHIHTVRPPPLKLAPASELLTSPETAIELSGSPVTAGRAGLLVDGDRQTVVRIDGKPDDQHGPDQSLVADIDLGVDCHIDSVHIWLPGGRGSETGHVHDFILGISGGPDGNAFHVPVKRITNPYWPMDQAPQPYVIRVNDINTVGRRLRLAAAQSVRGGLTCRLAVAEIQVFGSTAEGAVEHRIQLDQKPMAVEPGHVGPLDPQVQWIRDERIRLAWYSANLSDTAPGSDKTKAQVLADAGFNAASIDMRPDRPGGTWALGTFGKAGSTSQHLQKQLPPNVAEARRTGLKLFVTWHYGSHHQEPYRRYREMTTGVLNRMTCCPLDRQYIDRHITRWA